MNIFRRGLLVLFHPSDAFVGIKKERGHTDLRPAVALLILAVLVRIATIFIEHFPLASILPTDANIYMELVRIAVPALLVIISLYLVTTIKEGGTTIQETFVAGCYCLLPYILFTLPIAAFSHLLSASSAGLYNALNTIVWIWVFLLLFISIRDMNEYDFGEACFIVLLTALSVAIIVALALLFFGLTSQLLDFVSGLVLEIRLLMMG